ncbi:MAG: isocitrate lyase/phosphoenolpyruvate mutase family protein, partial [Paraglaciecola chathamensis]
AHMLGKNDGEQVLFSELIYLVKHILSAVNVPLTVDIESGYGRSAQEVASNILQLAQLGVAGINIEDSHLSHSDNTHSASRHLKTMD